MISPNMATTLGFVITDAAVTPDFLRVALREQIGATFNQISVDGDTSTNDSLFLMASGAAKNRPIDGGADGQAFCDALRRVLDELARLILRDGEGASHVVTIEVLGAETPAAAEQVARRIAGSPLVKTAFFGCDPNWGRIICAVGNSGVEIDPAKIDIAVDQFEIVRGGVGVGVEAERAAHQVMLRGEYTVRVDLHRGRAQARHVTCDLSVDYVKLNADYRS
jgi:glutamate N-acetyltransferase/amino-acid N-acetyltransferase